MGRQGSKQRKHQRKTAVLISHHTEQLSAQIVDEIMGWLFGYYPFVSSVTLGLSQMHKAETQQVF